MDLTTFSEKKEEEKYEVVEENESISISSSKDHLKFNFKDRKSLEKYADTLFFAPTESLVSSNKEELQKFFEKSISDGVEGLMVKNLSSTYSPGLRTGGMAKVKEVKDDIDVVILGAEFGTGKRAGFFSSFLVGALNTYSTSEEDQFLTIGKVSSGIKELGEEGASLTRLTQLLEPIKIREEKNAVYFEPQVIIEVRYQEIQESTTYSSGIALRFPRIMRLRDDKNLDEIATVGELQQFVSDDK